MNIDYHNFMYLLVSISGPLILFTYSLIPRSILNKNGFKSAKIAFYLSFISLGLALISILNVFIHKNLFFELPIYKSIHFSVYLDNLTSVMLLLVNFLLTVVTRFSVNYLSGDSNQGGFTKWLAMTGAAVLMLISAGNIIQFTIFWSLTSYSLHKLLVFYPNRYEALLAARKKFIISRLGDICLLGAIICIWLLFKTFEFKNIFTQINLYHLGFYSFDSIIMNLLAVLLILGAMLKSAQFPFHSWLPDTMETPTPVSALMHAGVINAGGYLILRLNPLVVLSPVAMTVLAIVGAFTALFASLVMLTHASIKRSLAFSTVAQMGFMMFECGLGLFGLALLHIIAHSLYKAYAFLSSGSIYKIRRQLWLPAETNKKLHVRFILILVTLFITILLVSHYFSEVPVQANHLLFYSILVMAIAYSLCNLWLVISNFQLIALGVFASIVIILIHLFFQYLITTYVINNTWTNTVFDSLYGIIVLFVILILFFSVLVLQTELTIWSKYKFVQRLYVHARNGFYFSTIANRVVTVFYPIK